MAQTIDELRDEIHAAFAARAYPGDEQLALEAQGDPTYEGNQVGRFFRGKDWREVTWQAILADRELDPNAFMFFLTPEGFVYYLPAFLHEALDLDTALDLASAVCFALRPPGEWATQEVEAQFQQKVALLSAAEKRAVAHVLEFLAAAWEQRDYLDNWPHEALNTFWNQFL